MISCVCLGGGGGVPLLRGRFTAGCWRQVKRRAVSWADIMQLASAEAVAFMGGTVVVVSIIVVVVVVH